MRTVTYMTLKASWAIRVTLTGYSVPLESHAGSASHISGHIWLSYESASDEIGQEELSEMGKAIMIAAPKLERATKGMEIVIIVTQISYNYTDFQKEGICAAMYSWLNEEFRLDLPNIPVSYNRDDCRYEFSWPRIG